MNSINVSSSVQKIILILWGVLVITLFFAYHGEFFLALVHPPYLSTIVTCLCIGGVGVWARKKFNFLNSAIFDYGTIVVFMGVIAHDVAIDNQVVSDFGIIQQVNFFKNYFGPHLATFFIVLVCYTFGRLWTTRVNDVDESDSVFVSIGLGIATVTLYLFILASFSILYWWMIWPVLFIPFIIQFKGTIGIVKSVLFVPSRREDFTLYSAGLRQFVLLFLAVFWIGAYKLFPTGFDSAAVYQNISNVLSYNHHHVTGVQAYNWSLFTSLGPLLFGKIEVSIFLSHFFITMCLWVLFALCRRFCSYLTSWMILAIVVALPMVGFLSFVDAKTDLGLTFILLVVLMIVSRMYENGYGKHQKLSSKLLITIGILLGFAMGIKYLAIFALVAITGVIAYGKGRSLLLAFWMFLSFAILFVVGAADFGHLQLASKEKLIVIIFCLLACGFTAYKIIRAENISVLTGLIKPMSIIGVSFVIGFFPWILKNTIESGKLNSSSVLYGDSKHNNLEINFKWLKENDFQFEIPKEEKIAIARKLDISADDPLFLDYSKLMEAWDSKMNRRSFIKRSGMKRNTGIEEEIQRYLGYEDKLPKYLSIPYDVTFGTNNSKRGNNVGFLFFLFLPILLLLRNGKSKVSLPKAIVYMSGLFTVLMLSVISTLRSSNYSSMDDYVLNELNPSSTFSTEFISSFSTMVLSAMYSLAGFFNGIYVLLEHLPFSATFILLSILAGAIFYYYRGESVDEESKEGELSYRIVVVFTICFGSLWFWFGNAINYYGLTMWILLTVIIAYWIQNTRSKDGMQSNFLFTWSSAIVMIYLIASLFLVFSPQDGNWRNSKMLYNLPFLYQGVSDLTADQAMDRVMPTISNFRKAIKLNPSGKIYRVGTFLNYHIPNNMDRVVEDNQLNLFGKVASWLVDPTDYVKILKLKGVRYILFDLKVASIDKTSEQTLVGKSELFVKVLNRAPEIKLLYTDRIVIATDPKTGAKVEKNDLAGSIKESGTFAIFEIE